MITDQVYRVRGAAPSGGGAGLPTPERLVWGEQRVLRPGGRRDASVGEVTLAADDLVQVTLANGLVLWTRADDLLRERGRTGQSRGGEAVWEIDLGPPARRRAGTRGALGLGIERLVCAAIDLRGSTAHTLAERLEGRQAPSAGHGLYRCDLGDTFALTRLPAESLAGADSGPTLLFIHGTASSCEGSFGALWDPGSQVAKAGRQDWSKRYGDRVLAWEHPSLTASPIRNALELVEELARTLPPGASLHLVTHSRGGLIGELLCLGELTGGPLDPALLDRLFTADRTIAAQLGLGPLDEEALRERDQAYAQDRKDLEQLLKLLGEKQWRIARFVRTACPARGTTLASGRLDRWLSILAHLGCIGLGLVAGAGLDFLLGVVKERTDPRTLPGLEAMMPGSALTRLLQHPDLVTKADLTVIAGDAEGESLWGQLKIVVADWFYGADHDLVVNTGSMFGGLRRDTGAARFLQDRGPQVNHFRYFTNDRSRRWLCDGLARGERADGGFQPLEPERRAALAAAPRWRDAVRRSRAANHPQPLAVLVPGIMGSGLEVDGREVWLNYFALIRGGLARLRLAGDEGRQVEPTRPLDRFYGPLLEFLARSHRVEVFPYDWRRSVRDAGQALAARLEAWLPELERTRQPVRLVAHSMGGLVVRAMIADGGTGAALWRRILALPESRLLMLGTPHLGSYETIRWLTGSNPTLAKLSLLDLTQGPNEIVDLVRAFPGLLELLPHGADDPDLCHQAFWDDLRQALGAAWKPADAEALRQARLTLKLLREAPLDPRGMVAVLGHRPATVAGYRLEGAPAAGPRRLTFLATAAGDGTVTWRSGTLSEVPVWYVQDTAHDALCVRTTAFPGYLDLLTTGRTQRLSATPPGGAREAVADGESFVLPAAPPTDDIPDAAAVESLGFGEGLPPADEETAAALPELTVSIRHGDLGYARYPVLLGHYAGDTIVGAELAMEQRLGGALSERVQLGLYPGRIGTHALFFNERLGGRPAGAIVIGLGQVGELSPSLLELSVRDALTDYAARVARWPDDRFGVAGTLRSAGVSCLLVGSGAGGLTVADVVKAILRGALAAGERLVQAGLEHRVAIDRLDFLEIYRDLAIAAARGLEEAIRDERLTARVRWEPRVVEPGEGGLRRVGCDETQDWWQRLEVVQERDGETLRFISATDRARAEVTLSAGQLRLADGFIAQACGSAAANGEAAKTLFEMLLPNRLRELAPQQRDLVVLVDEVAARFPWELLEDRWSHLGRPPAVHAGMLRQLKTPSYRPQPAHAIAPKALVIGNPDLDGWNAFADLPGARDEANRVAAVLRDHAYEVMDRIDEKADGILNGLHRDAWRILHLAGHGVHDYRVPARTAAGPCPGCGQSRPEEPHRVSGMVIGSETFLTPGDVEQMRWVPELVFINCCHLGKTQSATPPPYNQLAANLAVQFIQMGVKAVVAAGWAVDDRAGLAFAETFYRRLLAGAPFGEAVRSAREAIWRGFPDVNTWGAYQCYGDPAFRLRVVRTESAPLPPPPYHDPAELVADLERLTEETRMQVRLQGAGHESPEDPGKSIDRLLEAVPPALRESWLKRADVAAAVGLTWGENRLYDKAVDWLETALRAAQGDCPFRVVEQCNNFRVRAVGEQWRRLREQPEGYAKEDQRQALLERLDLAIAELAMICQRAATPDRLIVLGQACRYLAWLQTEPRGRLEALVNMANYLEQLRGVSDGPDPRRFPLWAVAKVLIVGLDPSRDGDWRTRLPDELRQMSARAERENRDAPSFRNAVAAVDNRVALLLLADGEVAPQAIRDLVDRYRAIFQSGASPREIASVQEYLDFIIDLGDPLPDTMRQAVRDLRGVL